MAGCITPSIDAGHEGVLVAKPILFGHGGVDPTPATTGRVAVAPTTDVMEGRSPELISRYGPNWYANNVKEAFRTFVREEVQKYQLFELTTNAGDPGEASGGHGTRSPKQNLR